MAIIENTINATSATEFIPTIWSDGVLEAAEFAAVIEKRVNTDFKDDLTMGATLNIPRLSNLTTQTKTAGPANTITFESVPESKQQVQITRHEYAAFMIESVVQVQANQDLRARYEKKLGYALARGRDSFLAGLFNSFGTFVGTAGVEMTADDYTIVWQKLAEAGLLEDGADPGADYSLILSPAAYVGLLKVDQFINQLYNGDDSGNAIQRAKVGAIFGLPVFRSNLLNVPSGGQHDCVAMHRDAIALIVQEEVPVTSQYMIRYLSDAVVAWNLYGGSKISFPPETPANGAAYTTTDNRGVWVKTV